MSQLHADQIVTLSLLATDAKGNHVDFTPDAAPTWINSNDSAATIAVSSDGLNSVVTPVAVGQSTTVNVSVSVGGTVFTASVQEDVVAGAIANMQIVETFSAPPLPTP